MNSNKVVELHPPAPVHAPCNSGSLSNQKIDYLFVCLFIYLSIYLFFVTSHGIRMW